VPLRRVRAATLFFTDDPLAINSIIRGDLAVSLTSELLAPQLRDVAVAPLTGEPVRRTVYAVTPPGRLHPLAGAFLDAIRAE
jgi:DNA-binding transcriptional LysR family regulator